MAIKRYINLLKMYFFFPYISDSQCTCAQTALDCYFYTVRNIPRHISFRVTGMSPMHFFPTFSRKMEKTLTRNAFFTYLRFIRRYQGVVDIVANFTPNVFVDIMSSYIFFFALLSNPNKMLFPKAYPSHIKPTRSYKN